MTTDLVTQLAAVLAQHQAGQAPAPQQTPQSIYAELDAMTARPLTEKLFDEYNITETALTAKDIIRRTFPDEKTGEPVTVFSMTFEERSSVIYDLRPARIKALIDKFGPIAKQAWRGQRFVFYVDYSEAAEYQGQHGVRFRLPHEEQGPHTRKRQPPRPVTIDQRPGGDGGTIAGQLYDDEIPFAPQWR